MRFISRSASRSSNGSRATCTRTRSNRSAPGAAGQPNLREPLVLDAASDDWPVDRADAVLSINMVHISPWAAALGLIAGAARLLPPGAPLILYGPWLDDAIPTAASNLAFDADLKARDPAWGLRRVEDFADGRARPLRADRNPGDAGQQPDAAAAPDLSETLNEVLPSTG